MRYRFKSQHWYEGLPTEGDKMPWVKTILLGVPYEQGSRNKWISTTSLNCEEL